MRKTLPKMMNGIDLQKEGVNIVVALFSMSLINLSIVLLSY